MDVAKLYKNCMCDEAVIAAIYAGEMIVTSELYAREEVARELRHILAVLGVQVARYLAGINESGSLHGYDSIEEYFNDIRRDQYRYILFDSEFLVNNRIVTRRITRARDALSELSVLAFKVTPQQTGYRDDLTDWLTDEATA